MKNRISIILIFVAIITTFSLLTTSCNKSEEVVNDETSASADDALAESLFNDVTNIADEAYDNNSSSLKSSDESLFTSNCAVITIDLTVFPRELTIDFGDENCLCEDGRYRRGIIIATFNGEYWESGTVITYGFDNYHVDDYKVDGTKVITNMGYNADSNLYYNINVVGVITFPDGVNTISWNASNVREWVAGSDTWTHFDDIYLISGTSNGIRSNGMTWTREIIVPLRIEIGCKWIVSGTMEIQPEGIPLRIVDWGSGECDNIATVLVNGVTYTILLP